MDDTLALPRGLRHEPRHMSVLGLPIVTGRRLVPYRARKADLGHAFIESVNGRPRDECRGESLFRPRTTPVQT